MIRRALIVLAIVVPSVAASVAQAGHHCREVSRVLGYSRCSRFGMWAHNGPSATWDIGASALRFDPKGVDATTVTNVNGVTTTYHLVSAPGDTRPITSAGGRFRSTMGFSSWFYVAAQMDLGAITSAPQLVADVSARGTTTTMMNSRSGTVMQATDSAGVRTWLGPAEFGGELGIGFRGATFSAADVPEAARPAAQLWLLVDARAHADLFFAPNWSLGVQVETDVLRSGDFAAGITLGAHLLPYDGLR